MNKLITTKKTSESSIREILLLADDMAAAMTSINPHNYSIFVESREKLKERIEKICYENDEAA